MPAMEVPEAVPSGHRSLGAAPDSITSDCGLQLCQSDGVEPIAVIGFSLRFPQHMSSADSLWETLAARKSVMTDFPKDRLNLEAFYEPGTERLNGFPLRGAHFINGDIAAFDAPFFSISPAEAAEMDPQQRGLLETSYRALENAGVPMEKATGSNTAVYTGCSADDYKAIFHKDPEHQAQYSASGVGGNMLANRISWFFNFSGTSLSLDTACSSSMVALHLACQGLKDRESNMALVGGCNLMFSPDIITALNNQKFLSPDSRCFSFDDRANGYARGEGFGVVVLKRLSDAIEQNDTIRAVIRATGSNQDGRTPGITQPSKAAQEKLIRDTYLKAGLSLNLTRYFEAHGTGTPVGDPIEAGAIGAVFQKYRSPSDPLHVGSIKANIGHLEGASGIAGVIKSIIMVEKGLIPPNAGFERVNPNIEPDAWNLKFPSKLTPWPTEGLRRISVNSFGFGGTNAHAVLDDAYHYLRERGINGHHCTSRAQDPHTKDTDLKHLSGSALGRISDRNGVDDSNAQGMPKLLILSAMDEHGLKRLESTYSDHFSRLDRSECNERYLERLAYTLNERRSSLLWKSFAVVSPGSDLQSQGLKLSKPVRSLSNSRLALCFTGQGAQWYAMGRELLSFSIFQKALKDIDAYLRTLGCSWSLLDELCKDQASSNVYDSAYGQPLCTAIQIAIMDLLRNFQIRPVTVVGHSSGEIAAAYSVGALDWQSATRVAYYRGTLTARLVESNSSSGTMISVGQSETEIQGYLNKVTQQFDEKGLWIGCINSPKNVTVTGRKDQIEVLKSMLDEDKIFAQKLLVNVAYHSPYLKSITAEYLDLIGELSSQHLSEPPTMVSSVTAEIITTDELRQGSYWLRNLVSPVRFSEALRRACTLSVQPRQNAVGEGNQLHIDDLLEIGPHSALRGSIRETLNTGTKAMSVEYSSALVRSTSATDSLFEALGRLYCRGHSMNLSKINQEDSAFPRSLGMLSNLPEYPFNHARSYWRESRLSKGHRFRQQPRNPFLGTPVPDWNPVEARWRRKIRLVDSPWLQDHKIHGLVLYPAAAMLVMAIEAAKQMSTARTDRHINGYSIRDVTFHKSLNIPADFDGVEVEFHLRPLGQASDKEISWSEFRLYAYESGEWADTCRGQIRVDYQDAPTEIDGGLESMEETRFYQGMLSEGKMACSMASDLRKMYEVFDQVGLGLGPTFQTLQDGVFNDKGEAVAEVNLHKWLLEGDASFLRPYVVHPTALDGLLQLSFLALSRGGDHHIPSLVPTRIHKLWVTHTGLSEPSIPTIKAYNKSMFKGFREVESSVVALDVSESRVHAVIEGFEMVSLGNKNTTSAALSASQALCFNVDQRPDMEFLDQESFVAYSRSVSPDVPAPTQFFRDLKLAMYLFLLDTLDSVSRIDMESLKPHHQQYLRWMKREGEKLHSSELPAGPLEWRKYSMDRQYQQTLHDRLEQSNKTGKLHVQVGRNLFKMLSGEIDPLDLFFRTDLVKDYYREFNKTTNGLNSFLIYLDGLAHKCPSMKILEIGAGTGGVTGHVLHTLTHYGEHESHVPRFGHYAYTDISPSFFETAHSMFKGLEDRVTFKTLDIEKDPSQQGFEEEAYDLIIADNVLHATRNLETSLRNARKLLKPGGKIALFELTEPEAIKTNFVFGLLPGWWRAADEYRDLSAGVTEKVWHEALVKAGFSGIHLSLPDYHDHECHEHSVMISTVLENPSIELVVPETLIVLCEGSSVQLHVANQLRERITHMGAPAVHVMPLEQAASMQNIGKMFCISLLEAEDSLFRNLEMTTFSAVRTIITTAHGNLWITRGGGKTPALPDHAIANGVFRTVRQENIQAKFVTISFEPGNSTPPHFVEGILRVFASTIRAPVDECEPEYVERAGRLCIDRLVEAEYLDHDIASRLSNQQRQSQPFGDGPPLALSIASPGLLDTLEFTEDQDATRPLDPDEIEIEVQASGVNFRDCLIALGRIPSTTMGFECAGTVRQVGQHCTDVRPGDRVCASAAGTFQTLARCKVAHVIPLPEQMSFLEGAALPVVFTTAYYALQYVARIQAGESILIHSGAGGTGQAAIQIAKLFGADIYVTVSSEDKRRLLVDHYGIPNDHIFYSRNASFAQGIKRMTRHRGGVDVVLNSLSGDALVNTWQCIAPFGRFLELGKKDILSNGSLPMLPFTKNVSFHAIDLNEAREHRPELLHDIKRDLIALIFAGKIKPAQPLHLYNVSEIEEAFRYLQGGRNTGKTVVEMRPDASVKTVLSIKPTWHFKESATYLISGGLGGIGRSIARWMVRRGAKNLILLSRFGPRTEAAQGLLQELRGQSIRVEAPPCDVSNEDVLKSVLAGLMQTLPPIKGCIQSSMLLKDSIFDQMSYHSWIAALEPKVQGSHNLHTVLPKGMDFFIMLSSIAGAIGSTTQANYSAGCAYQDALAHHRAGIGEKATTLNLGLMLEEGILAENVKIKTILLSTGYLMGIPQRELYALLEHHCDPAAGISTPLKTQVVVGIDVPASLQSKGVHPPTFMRRPPFRHFYNMRCSGGADKPGSSAGNEINFATLFAGAISLPDAAGLITEALMRKLSKALAVPLENLDPTKAMHVYGIDSLVAVELRNWFAQALDADVAIFDILGSASFEDVGVLVAGRSRLLAPAAGATGVGGEGSSSDGVGRAGV